MEFNLFKTAAGMAGAAVAAFFGGWDAALSTLIIFMIIDYISGLIVAAVFKKSPKTETGGLESRAGFKGLFRKGMTLFIVLIADRLDLVMQTHFVRDAVVIAYIINESVSIIENAGLMGLPVPVVITKAIDMLKKKADNEKGKKDENN